jgi:hypothetical protein
MDVRNALLRKLLKEANGIRKAVERIERKLEKQHLI